MHLKLPLLLLLGLNTVLMTTQSHAAESYTACTANEMKQIIQKHRLPLDTEFITDDSAKKFNPYACIKLPAQNQTVFAYTSKSNPIENSTDDQLSILLLSPKLKLHGRYDQKDFIDAGEFKYKGIRLENVPFSTLGDTTVLGLIVAYQKSGELTTETHKLSLFQIIKNNQFKVVLKDFPARSWNSEYFNEECGNVYANGYNRKIKLSDQVHHGLQDVITLTSKWKRIAVKKDCSSKVGGGGNLEFILKYDGQQYSFDETQLPQ